MWITRPSRTFIGARNPCDCQSYRATSHATYAACTTTSTGSSYWPTGSTSASAAAHCATSSYTPDTTTPDIDRIAAHPEDYDVAANMDPNARLEAETPDE